MEQQRWQLERDYAVRHIRSGDYLAQVLKFFPCPSVSLIKMSNFQRPYLSSRHTGFFLNNIVPFTNQIGFVYITNEDSIGQQILQGDKLSGDVTRIRDTVGLKTVLLSSDDERLVMLGQTEQGFHIYGSLFAKPHIYKELKLQDSKKMFYQPGRDGAYLKEQDRKTELYLTMVKTGTTHRLGLDSLFVQDTNVAAATALQHRAV